jgi:hypothetical protein
VIASAPEHWRREFEFRTDVYAVVPERREKFLSGGTDIEQRQIRLSQRQIRSWTPAVPLSPVADLDAPTFWGRALSAIEDDEFPGDSPRPRVQPTAQSDPRSIARLLHACGSSGSDLEGAVLLCLIVQIRVAFADAALLRIILQLEHFERIPEPCSSAGRPRTSTGRTTK